MRPSWFDCSEIIQWRGKLSAEDRMRNCRTPSQLAKTLYSHGLQVSKTIDRISWRPAQSESEQMETHVEDYAPAAVEDESEIRERADSIRGLAQLLQEYEQSHRLIAYEIHDGLAQSLAAAISFFEAFRYRANLVKEAVACEAFDSGMEALRSSHAEARRLIQDLRPTEATGSGLVADLERLINDSRGRSGIDIRFQAQGNCDLLPILLQRTVLRIASRMPDERRPTQPVTKSGSPIDGERQSGPAQRKRPRGRVFSLTIVLKVTSGLRECGMRSRIQRTPNRSAWEKGNRTRPSNCQRSKSNCAY